MMCDDCNGVGAWGGRLSGGPEGNWWGHSDAVRRYAVIGGVIRMLCDGMPCCATVCRDWWGHSDAVRRYAVIGGDWWGHSDAVRRYVVIGGDWWGHSDAVRRYAVIDAVRRYAVIGGDWWGHSDAVRRCCATVCRDWWGHSDAVRRYAVIGGDWWGHSDAVRRYAVIGGDWWGHSDAVRRYVVIGGDWWGHSDAVRRYAVCVVLSAHRKHVCVCEWVECAWYCSDGKMSGRWLDAPRVTYQSDLNGVLPLRTSNAMGRPGFCIQAGVLSPPPLYPAPSPRIIEGV
eukprot:1195407-Prorocentrum_minimum.AAC.3